MDNGASSYRRFLNGDDEGIAEIVREFKDGLIFFINSFVGNIYIAEDLAEDTFFRLMIKKPKYSGKSSFKSWLYAIGRNIAVDHVRHGTAHTQTSIEDIEAYISDEKDLERSYLQEEQKIALYRALEKLPSEYQQILWLIFFEGMSNKEAGIAMKKSGRQIRNLLYRAKQSLKKTLEKEGFDYEEF